MLAEEDGDSEAMARNDSAIRICDAIDNNRPAQGIPTLRDEFDIEQLDEMCKQMECNTGGRGDGGEPNSTGSDDGLLNYGSPYSLPLPSAASTALCKNW